MLYKVTRAKKHSSANCVEFPGLDLDAVRMLLTLVFDCEDVNDILTITPIAPEITPSLDDRIVRAIEVLNQKKEEAVNKQQFDAAATYRDAVDVIKVARRGSA